MGYTDLERKYYFPDIIKKVTTVVMSLFSNIRVAKYDVNGTIINYRTVPIVFGTKQAIIARIQKDEQKDFNMSLPKIAVVLTGLTPNPSKNTGPEILPILKYPLSGNLYENLYRPSTYTLEFTISILSQHLSETNQILEQILPYFNPYKIVTIQEFDMIPDFTRDIKINLTGTLPDLKDEVVEEDLRKIGWDITLTADCYLYKPILVDNIIKTVNVELFNMSSDGLVSEIVSSQFVSFTSKMGTLLGIDLEFSVEDDIELDVNGNKISSIIYIYDSIANVNLHDKVTGIVNKYQLIMNYINNELDSFTMNLL